MIIGISSCDNNLGIGFNNTILITDTEDLKHFKKKTTNHMVLMGRNTYESIGRVLPDRINIILSKTITEVPDAIVYDNIDSAIDYWKAEGNGKHLYIIGGEDVFNQTIDIMDMIYLSHFRYNIRNVNKYFPLTDRFHLYDYKIIREDFHLLKYCATERNNPYKYETVLQDILDTNEKLIENRTDIKTIRKIGTKISYDLSTGEFPLLTTKKVFFRGSVAEQIFFLQGYTDSTRLSDQKVRIWEGNTSREYLDSKGLTHYPVGDMGPTYGFNFRHYGAKYITCKEDYTGKGVDQLEMVIQQIRDNPTSRRIIINLWNPEATEEMSLPPCLFNYQFIVDLHNDTISLVCTMRSADMFLGVPFNLSGASIILYYVCSKTSYTPGTLTINMGDTHIYENHIEAAKEQLTRTARPFPKLHMLSDEMLEIDNYMLIGYFPHSKISGEMAV